MNPLDDIPYLGSGLGYRYEMREETLAHKSEIDFVEVITDQFIANPLQRDRLAWVCDHFTVIPHGVGLSIGSSDGVDETYLRQIRDVSDVTGSPYYSEHLCQTRAPGLEIGHLSPLWFSEGVLDQVIDSVNRVQDVLGKPLVLENVTYVFDVPNPEIPQVEFFNRLVDATGCGVLLDLTNVYINSVNHDHSAIGFLESMPLDHVVQIHLAGGYWAHDLLIDSHSESVADQTWDLLDELMKRTTIKGAILEHDSNFPDDFSELTHQLDRARQAMTPSRQSVPA